MKNIILVVGIILFCIAVGSAFGNEWGGFLVGVILSIVIAKRFNRVKSDTPN